MKDLNIFLLFLTISCSQLPTTLRRPSSINENELVSRLSSPKACLEFIKRNKDIEYNWIEVPLYDDEKKSKSTLLQFYYRKKKHSQKESNFKARSVFINGGPASSSHSSFQLVKKYVDSSVLFFDQRGTGCSEKYSKADSINEFGSRGISRDISKVLNYLNVDKVKLIGHSYGAKIAQRFTTIYPQMVSDIYTYADFALNFDEKDQFKEKYDLYTTVMNKRRKSFASLYPKESKKIDYLERHLSKDHCISDIQNLDNKLCGIETIFALNWWFSDPDNFKVSAEWINFLVQDNNINYDNLYKFTTRNSFKNYSMLTAALKEKEYSIKSNIDECLKISSDQRDKLNSMCLQIWPLMRWQGENNIKIIYDPILEKDFMKTLNDYRQITAWHYTGLHDSRAYKASRKKNIINNKVMHPENFHLKEVNYAHWEYLRTTSFWVKVLTE